MPQQPTPQLDPTQPNALRNYLRNCEIRNPQNPLPFLLLALGLILISLFYSNQYPILHYVPWLILISLLAYLTYRARQTRALEQSVREVFELSITHHPQKALDLACSLLPRLTSAPPAHGQIITLISANLNRLHFYEPASDASSYLIELIHDKHPASAYLRLQRAKSYLHLEQLADADDELRRLRNADLSSVDSALFTACSLYQQIKTHHHQDAANLAPNAVEQLKPLGADAGYAYGLIATAFHHLNNPAEAQAWWRKATLLLPPTAIAYDYPETAPLLKLKPAPSLQQILDAEAHV